MGQQPMGRVDRVLRPLHRWIWRDPDRRARKLLAFAEVEAEGGRDILRAAEVTRDPLLRRLYLEHAIDELHHADLFHDVGGRLLRTRGVSRSLGPTRLGAGDHGLNNLRVDELPDSALLAFLHLSETAAAARFAIYRDLVADDPSVRSVFDEILHDELFHMNYTGTQLARVAPGADRGRLWRARVSRLWKRYLRLATVVASGCGTVLLTVQYFILLPPFAWLAKRAARREGIGWMPVTTAQDESPTSQY